jgi:peptide/nickel transport system substrate-binding protein
VIRFQAGDTDVIEGLSAEDYAVLERDAATRGYVLRDLGPGLEYSFVFFNLNDLPGDAPATLAARQVWFRKQAFRQAVSRSIDRPGLVRLAYRGRAATLASHVTPGNRLWFDASLQPGLPSGAEARALLRAAGFSWDPEDRLVDAAGEHVEFSILTSAGNATRRQMATIVQDDLTQLGMRVHVVPLETSALLERVLRSFDYEACLLALRSGDVDPNSEMNVWLSSGATHLWSLSGSALPAWQQEIDSLMHRQLSTLDHAARKQLYARVQAIVADQLPIIPLVSPSILVGVKKGLENFRPAILSHYTLWNADELYWRRRPEGSR